MISYEIAYNIAKEEIEKLSEKHDFVILDTKIVEREFGWVFFYVTRKYFETMNPRFMVPGTAPLVVHKKDGSVLYLPTSLPPMRAIDEYEAEWLDQNKPSCKNSEAADGSDWPSDNTHNRSR